jgi:hypothetical protein
MSASIRGHQGSFKIFRNGQVSKIVDITSIDISQDSSFSRTFYVGKAVPEGDQTIEGWSGSLELEVKDQEVDKFIDALVTNNLNGIGVEDVTFITTERYPDGRIGSYVYFDCQFKMSKRQSGLNEKMTKRLEFQASGRLPL